MLGRLDPPTMGPPDHGQISEHTVLHCVVYNAQLVHNVVSFRHILFWKNSFSCDEATLEGSSV